MLNNDAIFWSLVIGGLFGGVLTAVVYNWRNRSLLAGVMAGMIAGGLGGQILMVPMQHCPFVQAPMLVEQAITQDEWTITGEAGQTVFITLTSATDLQARFFDSQAGRLGGAPARTRDDGFVVKELTLPDDGIARVVVESRNNEPGAYHLRATAAEDAEASAVDGGGFSLNPGEASAGEIIFAETRFINQDFLVGVFAVLFSSLLLLIPLWVWTVQGRKLFQMGVSRTERFGKSSLPYLFLIPTLVILVFFLYWPMVRVIVLSFQSSQLGANAEFNCVTNYVRLFNDAEYIQSFTVTFTLTVAIVVVGMGLALAISMLASQRIRFANVYRTLLIWPYALSPVIAGLIFLIMFNPQVGPINQTLNAVIGVKPSWFSDGTLAPWVIILSAVWNNLGFNVLFYIAGLQSVPDSLLEAAAIDGANAWQRFWRITFPMLSPFTFFLLITNVTYAFYGIFGAIDALTQGGPGGATKALIYKLYVDAFEYQKTGAASAQSFILFLLVAGLTIFQFRLVERRITYAD